MGLRRWKTALLCSLLFVLTNLLCIHCQEELEDIDDCLSQPCANNGTCEYQPCANNGTCFKCICAPEWTGPTCMVAIQDEIQEDLVDDSSLTFMYAGIAGGALLLVFALIMILFVVRRNKNAVKMAKVDVKNTKSSTGKPDRGKSVDSKCGKGVRSPSKHDERGSASEHSMGGRSASKHSSRSRSASKHSMGGRSASRHSMGGRSASRHSINMEGRSSSRHSMGGRSEINRQITEGLTQLETLLATLTTDMYNPGRMSTLTTDMYNPPKPITPPGRMSVQDLAKILVQQMPREREPEKPDMKKHVNVLQERQPEYLAMDTQAAPEKSSLTRELMYRQDVTTAARSSVTATRTSVKAPPPQNVAPDSDVAQNFLVLLS